jgi:hypothetical protein
MSIIGNGTTGASGTGPASGYNLELSHLLVVFLYRLSVNTSNPYDTIMLLISTHSMICFMIFGIKICHKMPKSLTFRAAMTGTLEHSRTPESQRERSPSRPHGRSSPWWAGRCGRSKRRRSEVVIKRIVERQRRLGTSRC